MMIIVSKTDGFFGIRGPDGNPIWLGVVFSAPFGGPLAAKCFADKIATGLEYHSDLEFQIVGKPDRVVVKDKTEATAN
jgi:hypothetical protein